MWRNDRVRRGDPSFDIEPEPSELIENGFFWTAQSMLMRNMDEYRDYLERELGNTPKKSDSQPFECDFEEAMRTGIYTSGTSGCGKSDLAMYISDMLMSKGIINLVVDGSQDWEARSSIPYIQKVCNINEIRLDRSTIFDTSELTVSTQREFIELLCATIWRHQTTVKPRKPIFLWLEEGHLVFPLGSFRSNKYVESVRLLTVGRNIDVRMGVITQFASLISKDAMKFMKQRYFGYSEEPNDLKYVSEFIGAEKSRELKTLENGYFVYSFKSKSKVISIEPYRPRSLPQLIETEQPIQETQQPETEQKQNLAIGYLIIGFAVLGLLALVTLLLR